MGLPVEGVDLLGTGVAQEEWGVVGGHAEPDVEEAGLAEIRRWVAIGQ